MPKRASRRGKSHQTKIPPAPAGELQRHLRELGLESVHAYQAWCRAHGFRPGLDKNWHERRQEVRRAQRDLEEAAAGAARQSHIQKLRLSGPAEYEDWCARHGFSPSARKSAEQRRQELLAAERARAQAALASTRRQQRRPEDLICRLARGEIDAETLRAPHLRLIYTAFAATRDEGEVGEALLRLLLQVRRCPGLFDTAPVVPHLGPQAGNTFIEALLALARRHERWIRPPEAWRPESRNTHRQFHSLACYLLARYFVPPFMDAAWFSGDTAAARREQDWFLHIGAGQNLRTAELPLRLTKMAAHHFLRAPAELSIEAALRWGQVLALGGDEYLARTVIATRLGALQEEEGFWESVLHFFVNNPMLDPACVGPIVDYVHHRKYVPQETVEDGGAITIADPSEPQFTMKGRTVPALWERVEAWHRQLARETRRPPVDWEQTEIGEFCREERDPGTGRGTRWIIRELLSSRDLAEEGREMHHCVASYARSCGKRHVSIWSMQLEDAGTGHRRRVMTIEVRNVQRTIVQARGRCNKTPGQRHSSVLLERAPEMLHRWAKQEGLRVLAHL